MSKAGKPGKAEKQLRKALRDYDCDESDESLHDFMEENEWAIEDVLKEMKKYRKTAETDESYVRCKDYPSCECTAVEVCAP